LPPKIFYLDESIGYRLLVDELRKLGHTVYRWQDLDELGLFEGQNDPDWLRTTGARGWILLTRDKHIMRRFLEFSAASDADAKLFVVVGKMTGEDVVNAVVSNLRKIIMWADDYIPPFLARISDGNVAWVDHAHIRKPVKRSAMKRR